MAEICTHIPDAVSAHHGYHSNCSKRFTMNLKRLRVQSENNDNEDNAACTGQPPRKKASILFPRECIFCGSESYIYDEMELTARSNIYPDLNMVVALRKVQLWHPWLKTVETLLYIVK